MATRPASKCAVCARANDDQGCEGIGVELDLMSQDSIAAAVERIRTEAGYPEVGIYNAGYSEGRSLPKEQELLEFLPVGIFDTAIQLAARAPFLVAKEVLPAMRKRGSGSLFFSNNRECQIGRASCRERVCQYV